MAQVSSSPSRGQRMRSRATSASSSAESRPVRDSLYRRRFRRTAWRSAASARSRMAERSAPNPNASAKRWFRYMASTRPRSNRAWQQSLQPRPQVTQSACCERTRSNSASASATSRSYLAKISVRSTVIHSAPWGPRVRDRHAMARQVGVSGAGRTRSFCGRNAHPKVAGRVCTVGKIGRSGRVAGRTGRAAPARACGCAGNRDAAGCAVRAAGHGKATPLPLMPLQPCPRGQGFEGPPAKRPALENPAHDAANAAGRRKRRPAA